MISKTTCTGCGACSIVCPNNCIKMHRNDIGELEPAINNEQCIHCNICSLVCPQNHPPAFHTPIRCYVAWSKNESDWITSASGGAASAFSRWQLDHGGKVFGCDYDESLNLQHFELKNSDELNRAQSSKYSQSSAFVCYNAIEDFLIQKYSVLFIGTPCQVSGLKNYLRKDYPELITIDLVCHGTPPTEYLQQHVKSISNGPVSKLRFRGEYDQQLTIWSNDNIIYRKSNIEDSYFFAFYQNMISRNSCYDCQYATDKRVSDITIGDFWGLNELNSITAKSSRPSLILINTDRGELFFSKLNSCLYFEERSTTEGISGNGRLNHPPGRNRKARLFQKYYYRTQSFDTSVKRALAADHRYSYYISLFSFPGRVIRRIIRFFIRLLGDKNDS